MNSVSALSDNHLNLLKNELAVREGITYAFNKVIEWSCKKNISSSFEDYLTKNKGNFPKKFEKWVRENSDKLKQTSTDNYDVTFLYSLIPLICDDIAVPNTEEWADRMKDVNSIEFKLRQVKELRNALSHEPDKANSSSLFDDIKKNLDLMLQSAANRVQVTQLQLNDARKNLEEKFINIAHQCVRGDWLCKYVKTIVRCDSRNIVIHAWKSKNSQVTLPLNNNLSLDRTSVYCPITVSVPNKIFPDQKDHFTSNDILKCGYYNFKILKGNPGAGKTTTLKYVMDCWLKLADGIKNLKQYDIAVFVLCRTNSKETITELLAKQFSEAFQFLPKEEVSNVLNHLQVLFLLDGYDEMNTASKKLFSNILDGYACHQNWTVLISSRPQAVYSLRQEFSKRGLVSCYDTISLEPITSTEGKKIFLEKYFLEDSKGSGIGKTLIKLPENVTDILDHPALLTMAFVLMKRKFCAQDQLASERNLFATVFRLLSEEIGKKFEDSFCLNPRTKASKFLEAVGALCLEMYSKGEFVLKTETYESFVRTCTTEISDEISYDSILSSIFSRDDGSYYFPQTSLQEYLAAMYILNQLNTRKKEGTSSLFRCIKVGPLKNLRKLTQKSLNENNAIVSVIKEVNGSVCVALLNR